MNFAFDEFAHILWGVKKPTIVMTDNKALTRFFQSKRIPPKLWNYCDQALQFDFVLAHVSGVEPRRRNTCPESTSTLRTGSTSNCTMRYLCSKLRSTSHRKRPNKMMTKKNAYPTRRTCLMKRYHQTQQCSHSWRCSLNGVTKTKSSTVDALTTSRPRCNCL